MLFLRYITVFDQDEIILSHFTNTQVRYNKNNFNFSIELFLKNKFLINRPVLKYTNFFDYITYLNDYFLIKPKSLFFQTGWYINQSVISSFCLDINDYNSIKSLDSNFTIIQKENKFGFKFKIRNNDEFNYMKFICKINDKLSGNLRSNLKIKDYYRFFYILYDCGGKSVFDSNNVFTLSTHGPIQGYSIQNNINYNNHTKNSRLFFIDVNSNFTFHADYKLSHILHFRNDLNFLLQKNIFPNSIGFDLNYFNLYINSL